MQRDQRDPSKRSQQCVARPGVAGERRGGVAAPLEQDAGDAGDDAEKHERGENRKEHGWTLAVVRDLLRAGFQRGYSTMHVADSKRLTNAGAKAMLAAALAKARDAKIAVAIAIADAGGHLILLERMDGGRFHTVHSATTKAVCAASTRRPTSARGAAGQALDVAHALGLSLAAGTERWTAMEGGCPIIVGGECVGGIGVSGGDWQTDVAIAQAAVEAIGAKWTSDPA
jgi:uncharacterized protein GlcG (DUF336 family)